METTLIIEVLAVLALVGALGGFLSGLLGIGGGAIFVPGLYFAFQASGLAGAETMHLSVGTSLAIVMATSIVSARGHQKRGSFDFILFKRWAPFLVLGVLTGGMIAGWVNGRILTLVFSMIMVALGIYMALRRVPGKDDHYPPSRWLTPVVQRAFALGIGMISAMIGLGGGVLAVPLMMHAGISQRRAAGTGAAVSVAVSLPGMISYMGQGFLHPDIVVPPLTIGYVNLAAVLVVAPVSMLMAPVGVRAAHHFSPKILRAALVVVLFAVATKMFVTALSHV